MQEINYARQESSAQSSARKGYRYRVCDGPVEWPDIVCRECWKRDREEQEWESYLDFLDGDDTTPENPEPPTEDGCRRSIPRERPMLIVLCGPSHTGKSEFARKLPGDFKVISSDEIRKRLTDSFRRFKDESKLWNVFESLKCRALKKGQNIILDACHISRKARRHSLQGTNAHHEKICVVFDLPFRTIQERCLREERVPIKEVERMWKVFQSSKPTPEGLKLEGFDEVYFVRERSVAYPFKGIGNSLGSDYHTYLLFNFQKKATGMRPHQAYCITSGLATFHATPEHFLALCLISLPAITSFLCLSSFILVLPFGLLRGQHLAKMLCFLAQQL